MHDFVHLHVHTQYSILDGQASIQRLVDKAIADGMKGIAITDHGNMFGIKEFWNYVNKKNGDRKKKVAELSGLIERLENGTAKAEECGDDAEQTLADARTRLAKLPKEDFKAIIGCEVYVARNGLHVKNAKEDQSGYHLILLAKNQRVTKILSR